MVRELRVLWPVPRSPVVVVEFVAAASVSQAKRQAKRHEAASPFAEVVWPVPLLLRDLRELSLAAAFYAAAVDRLRLLPPRVLACCFLISLGFGFGCALVERYALLLPLCGITHLFDVYNLGLWLRLLFLKCN